MTCLEMKGTKRGATVLVPKEMESAQWQTMSMSFGARQLEGVVGGVLEQPLEQSGYQGLLRLEVKEHQAGTQTGLAGHITNAKTGEALPDGDAKRRVEDLFSTCVVQGLLWEGLAADQVVEDSLLVGAQCSDERRVLAEPGSRRNLVPSRLFDRMRSQDFQVEARLVWLVR